MPINLIYFLISFPFFTFLSAFYIKNDYLEFVAHFIKSISIGVFISAVNFIIQVATFLISNLIVRNLGTVNFAYFGILQSDYLIFSALADFGMMTLILAFFGKRAAEGRLLSQILQLRFFCAGISMLLYFGFAALIRQDHPAFCGELILAVGLLFQHAFFDWYFICSARWKQLLASKLLHTFSYSAVMCFALFYLKISSIEGVALAMVFAGIPGWSFGAIRVLSVRAFQITRRSIRFFKLMFKSAFPYALASIASFMYLPTGLYAVDRLTSPEYLASYNFAHKIIILTSGFMVHFISSTLITLHRENSSQISLKNHFGFILFIAFAASPLYLFPKTILSWFFFAAPWTDSLLALSGDALRFLSFSLIFQAIRLPIIALFLKEKQIWKYVCFVVIAGITNILTCIIGLQTLPPETAPKLALTGDIVLTLSLCVFAWRKKLFDT